MAAKRGVFPRPGGRRSIARRIACGLFACFLACLPCSAGTAAPSPARDTVMAAVLDSLFAHTLRKAAATASAEPQRAAGYATHSMTTRRRGPIVRFIPDMFTLEHGHHRYEAGGTMLLRMRRNEKLEAHVTAVSGGRTPGVTADRLAQAELFIPSLSATMLMSAGVLNPLHPRNRHFYRYRLTTCPDTAAFWLGYGPGKLMRLSFTPRFHNDALTAGYVDLRPSAPSPLAFSFTLHYRFQRVTVTGTVMDHGNDGTPPTAPTGAAQPFPDELTVESRFRIFGNHVNEITRLHLQPELPATGRNGAETADRTRPTRLARHYDLTDLLREEIDTGYAIIRPARFDTLLQQRFSTQLRLEGRAPIVEGSLERAETMGDTLLQQGEGEAYDLPRFSLTGGERLDRTRGILLSSHSLPLCADGRLLLRLPPLLTPSMIGWSGTKGLSLSTRLRLSLRQPGTRTELLTFSPYLGYSFRQRQLYYQLPLALSVIPSLSGQLGIEAGGGSQAYSSQQADALRDKLAGLTVYDSLRHVIDAYGFHDYRDHYLKTDLSLTPHPWLTLIGGTRFHHRSLIAWNAVAKDLGLKRVLNSLSARVELSFTPGLYYYRQDGRTVPLSSHWPTLRLCYERALPIGDRLTQSERLEGDLRYTLPLYAMRTLLLRLGGGVYTRRSDHCFIDYDYFRFNYITQAGGTDAFAGELQLLSSRWYNESRHYAQLTATYESPLMTLSRLSLLSRAIRRERLYLGVLTMQALGFYGEAGYGLTTHLVDLGLFTGFSSKGGGASFGCKVAIHLFED